MKIKDSNNQDTVEVSVNGWPASAPNAKSMGKYEALPYHREGIDWNLTTLNALQIPFPIDSFDDLILIEQYLMKTYELVKIQDFGANALYALETALLKALAATHRKQLWEEITKTARKMPIPIGNAIGGGLHSASFLQHPTFQEFLIIPNESSFEENVRSMREIYRLLGKELQTTEINEEGAWQTSEEEEETLGHLQKYVGKVKLGVDVAASSFFREGTYSYRSQIRERDEQISHMNELIKAYNLSYVEDPMYEEDFAGFSKINKKAIIAGDDLTVTNKDRLEKAIKSKAVNGVVIKPTQIGSLLAMKEVISFGRKAGLSIIMSHRSGETMDDALADIAFALGVDYIKCGIATPCREVKLARLIAIERALHKTFS